MPLNRRNFLKGAALATVFAALPLGSRIGVANTASIAKPPSLANTSPIATTPAMPETPTISPSPAASTSTPAIGWMINLGAVKLLEQYVSNGLTQEELNNFFNTPQTYVVGGDRSVFPNANNTEVFTDYNALASALTLGTVASNITAIVYDNEAWQLTPLEQQQNPAKYEQMAAHIVHQYHLKFISTPAIDLVTVNDPLAKNGNKYNRYIANRYAADAARYADIYEIQAQHSELDTAQFSSFVSQAATQAKQANPNVIVFAGISTNPMGQTVTGDQLYQAVQVTRNYVSGYWLNIPKGGMSCPNCGTPQPQVAVILLNDLWNQRSTTRASSP